MTNLSHARWSHGRRPRIVLGLLALASLAIPVSGSRASNHREAPITALDRPADTCDVYAFVSLNDPLKVTMILTVDPLLEPGLGPQFAGFDDDVLYEIRVDNDGNCLPDVSFQFSFTTALDNATSARFHSAALDHTLAGRNVRQSYSLHRVTESGSLELISGAPVAPPRIGPRSNADMTQTMLDAVQDAPDGSRVFAGTVDDPFYLDLGAFFDLLTVREPPGSSGGGLDALSGFNVSALALQVPIELLTASGTIPSDPTDPESVLGIWSSAYRARNSVRTRREGTHDFGDPVQVSRLGMPLVNLVLVPLGDRDSYNRRGPATDFELRFFLQFSDIPSLLGERLGVEPPFPPRDDVVDFFYHSNQTPAGCVGDVLRLNVAIPPSENPHRLGQLGGDPAGFPNGRRLTDDVLDVTMNVLLGAVFAPIYGDGVDANDKPFLDEFPYLGTPHEGFLHSHGHELER